MIKSLELCKLKDQIGVIDAMKNKFYFKKCHLILDFKLDGQTLQKENLEKITYVPNSKNLFIFAVLVGLSNWKQIDLEVYSEDTIYWRQLITHFNFNRDLIKEN